MLIDGFKRLMNSRCAEVVQLFSRDYQGGLTPLSLGNLSADPENLIIMSLRGLLESRVFNSDTVKLTFTAPLKLRDDGHQVRHFEFGLFFRSVLRRVSALAYYYDQFESASDFRNLAHQADLIVCIQNEYSFASAPLGKKKYAGINGEGVFRGNFSDMMPFLLAGTVFSAGRNASSGFGRYCITAEYPGPIIP